MTLRLHWETVTPIDRLGGGGGGGVGGQGMGGQRPKVHPSNFTAEALRFWLGCTEYLQWDNAGRTAAGVGDCFFIFLFFIVCVFARNILGWILLVALPVAQVCVWVGGWVGGGCGCGCRCAGEPALRMSVYIHIYYLCIYYYIYTTYLHNICSIYNLLSG